ncbi:MAG: hypothetical protein QXQ50_10000 [Candidatus Bathyarchaeia archaeon]
MSEDAVGKYYAKVGLKEWRRLVRDPYHRLEFDTTMHFLGNICRQKVWY